MKYILLLISTAALAAPPLEEAEKARKAKAAAAHSEFVRAQLATYLPLMEQLCQKKIRLTGQQTYEIVEMRCGRMRDNPRTCYYVQFEDNSAGSIGWDFWRNSKPTIDCDLSDHSS